MSTTDELLRDEHRDPGKAQDFKPLSAASGFEVDVPSDTPPPPDPGPDEG